MGVLKNKDKQAKLAILIALEKRLKQELATSGRGHVDNLRSSCDEDLRRMYQELGVSKVDLRVGDSKVGTISARVTKAEKKIVPMVDDAEKFAKWIYTTDSGLDTIKRLLVAIPDKVLQEAIADGELPDGCKMIQMDVPEHFNGTTVRVDDEKVVKALGDSLPSVVTGLLKGGTDE